MSWERFTLGVAILAIVLGTLGWAAVQVRRSLGLSWASGASARLVECVIGLAIVTFTSLMLGGLHWFAGWPLFVSLVGVSVILGVAARHWLPSPPDEPMVGADERDEKRQSSRRFESVAAVVALSVVGAQWVSHTAWALGHGMTEGDTLWYHGVFAARFVQTGRLDIFPDLGAAAQGYFPANSQMFHALTFFPFDRDLLSPVLNLGFGAIAVLAAYCIGRRRGLGAICVTAAAVVLGLPAIVGTHPGQATNDFACAALLLVAIAVLIEGGLEPVPISFAAIAAALSLGTKLTVAVPITVLTLALLVIAARRRRLTLAMAWLLPLVAFGAFWFVRNWARAGNPLPWYELNVGPLHFPAREHLADNASVADHLFEAHVWSEVFRPGLRLAFGRAWPLFVAAPGLAGLLIIGRGRRPAERLAGAVTVAAGLGYLTMPFTMELGGIAFSYTARYASPALLTGLVLLPLALRLDRARFWWRLLASVTGVILITVNASGANLDRFAPWRPSDRLLSVLVVVVIGMVVALARWGGRPMRVLLVVPVVVAIVFGGFVVQRHYLTHRYAQGAGLRLDRANEFLSRKDATSVAPFDTVQFYPFFGPSFANTVVVVSPPSFSTGSNLAAVRCREWERALRQQNPRFVLYAKDSVPKEAPARDWVARSPSVRVIERDATSTLFKVRGRLRLACP